MKTKNFEDMSIEEIETVGKKRISTLQELLEEGTPFIDDYKKLIEKEQRDLRKTVDIKKDER